MTTDIESRVAQIIAEVSNQPLDKILPTATMEDLGIESLDVVEITTLLETEFNVIIMDADMSGVQMVGDVVKIIEKLESQN